jgi:hypothetical protein
MQPSRTDVRTRPEQDKLMEESVWRSAHWSCRNTIKGTKPDDIHAVVPKGVQFWEVQGEDLADVILVGVRVVPRGFGLAFGATLSSSQVRLLLRVSSLLPLASRNLLWQGSCGELRTDFVGKHTQGSSKGFSSVVQERSGLICMEAHGCSTIPYIEPKEHVLHSVVCVVIKQAFECG